MGKYRKSLGIVAFLLMEAVLFSGAYAATEPARTLIDDLSAPAFAGRSAGSAGLAAARDRIIAELKSLGIGSGIADGSYLQKFSYFSGHSLGAENSLSEASAPDFVPYAFSSSGKANALPLVFAGYGISAQESGKSIYDDYRGLEVKGKAVVVFLGDPGIGNEKSFFRDPKNYFYSSLQHKAETALHRGAKAIFFVRGPQELAGALEPPLKFSEHIGSGAKLDILAMRVSGAWAEKMLEKKLAELQEKISISQKPSSFSTKKKIDLSVDIKREVGELQNIIALVPGSDARRSKEFFLIGAHYDHLGMGGENSREPGDAEKLHPGADDNASGVFAVIQLAKQLKQSGKNRRAILVVFFSGEEIGLAGSRFFVENAPIPNDGRLLAAFNFDMVGRMQQNRLNLIAAKSAAELPVLLQNANRKLKLDLAFGDSGFGSSDHFAFLEKSIPAVFFTTGAHEDYHRASDTAEKIDYSGISKIVDLAALSLIRLDQFESTPHFSAAVLDTRDSSRSGHGYGAYFGTIPDFTETNEGVLLKGVKVNSPAEKAGLKEKDLLTGLGDVKIRNLYDFVYALRFYRAGDELGVTWLREGKPMEAKAKLEVRNENRAQE